MDESNLESVMGLIMYGGKPKVMLWRLFRQQKGDFSKANRRLADANAALLQAHKAQTEMLTREAQGKNIN